MKIVLALLTALTLIVGQTGTVVAGPAKPACCGNCAGACCVQSESLPLAAQPLAPAATSPAPGVESILPSVELPSFLRAVEISPPVSPRDVSFAVVALPLYRSCGGLLI